MNWNEFVEEKKSYKKAWELLKEGFSGDERKFLDRSYLVAATRTDGYEQVHFDFSDPGHVAKDCPGFFAQDRNYDQFINLLKRYEKSSDKDAAEKIREFDTSRLNVRPFTVEVRFPTVKMDIIKKVKRSGYCDRDLTDMSDASINVVLKKVA